ncbi:MAG: VOC family protein [Streptococcaceae bacterium]|nr:VOC family protein [Streptococcaceae bacterium]
MINHFGIAVKDVEKSVKFYQAALAAFGYKIHHAWEKGANFTDGISHDPYGDFEVHQGEPHPFHFAFQAKTNQEVDAWYAEAMANGGTDNGAPGYRMDYRENYYAAFIVDPDGYRIEAVCHNGQPHGIENL